MREARGPTAAALALTLGLSAFAAACGEQEEPPRAPERPGATQSVPRSTGEAEDRPRGEEASAHPEGHDRPKGAPRPGGASSGGERPSYDPRRPDAPGNDRPPPPGSPAERFEHHCEANPEDCY